MIEESNIEAQNPLLHKADVIGSGECLAQKLIRIAKEKRKNAKRGKNRTIQ